MRCGAIITYKERRNQSGTSMVLDRRNVQTWWGTSDKGVFPKAPSFADYLAKPNTKVCEGEVAVKVEAEEEPYYGGSSAVLSIKYECNFCGNTFFPELPQTGEGIALMVESFIGLADEETLRRGAQARELQDRERQQAMFATMDAELKERERSRREDKARKDAERLARTKPTG